MPIDIPILYTGLNAAKPDWKNFWSDYGQRVSSIQARQQQQRQFDALEQDKLRREFLESINVDDINSTNELLLAKKYEITKGVEDYLTKTLTEKGGKVDDKDILQARLLTNRANQEISKLNAWSKNQAIDIATVKDHPEWFDQEKVKQNIINWNPDRDGAYNKSKLEDSFKDIPIGQVIEQVRADITNANTASVISEIGGIKINSKKEWNEAYEERDPDTGDYLGSKDAGQINFVVTDTAKGDSAFLNQRSIDKNWSDLTDDVAKQSYENRAVKAGYKPEYGKYLYLIDQGKLFDKNRDITTSTTTSPIKEETEKQYRKDGKIDLTESRDVNYGGRQFSNVYDMPEGIQLQEGVTINGAEEETSNGFTEPSDMTYDNPTLVGVNTNDKGKIDKVFLRVRTDKYEVSESGEPIFTYEGMAAGTKDEIIQKMEILTGAKIDGIQKDFILNNLKRQKSSTPSYKTIVAPAYENKFLLKKIAVKGETGVAIKETPKYLYNGKEVNISAIEEAAKASGVSVDEYIKQTGITKK